MDLKDYIGKREKVKILQVSENKKYFKGIMEENGYDVFIENDGEFEPEEIVGTAQECIIVDVIKERLIGFILSNRKFENDLKKIDEKLKFTDEYDLINDIYLMERLKIKGRVLGLYMVDEGDIGKYYLDTMEIGLYDKKIIENNILFRDKKIEDELGKDIRDVVKSIDLTKKEISLRMEEEKMKNLIREALGLEKDGIMQIATIDLNQKIKIQEERDKKQEINDKQLEQIKEHEDMTNRMKNKPIEYSQKGDVNVKQELNLNSKVTDMKTLEQILAKNGKLPQIDGKKFTKMGIIESNHRDDLVDAKGKNAKENSSRYSFVAIANDGTIVPLELSQDRQEERNPVERNYQIDWEGKVQQDDVSSRYNIGNGTLAIKNGKYGEIKVYHSPKKTLGGEGIEGNRSLDVELETNNVWSMKKKQRDIASEYKTGYRSVERSYKEAKQHENEKGEISKQDEGKLRTEDVDGNPNTKSHMHSSIDYNVLASKWGYYNDGKPNAQKAQELFEEKAKANPNKKEKEIIEMVSEDLENQLHHRRGER